MLDKTIGMNTNHQYCPQLSAKVINRIVTGQAMLAAIASPVLGGFWTGATVRGLGADGATGALCRCHGGAWKVTGSTAVEGRGSGRSENSGVISAEVFACKRPAHPLVELPGIQPALGQVLPKELDRTITVRVTDPRLDASPAGGAEPKAVEVAGSTGSGSEEVGSLTRLSILRRRFEARARTLQCFANGRRRRGPRSAEVWRLVSRRR